MFVNVSVLIIFLFFYRWICSKHINFITIFFKDGSTPEGGEAELPIDENVIRITSQGRMRSYITYAMALLEVASLLLIHNVVVWGCLFKLICGL